MRIAPPSGATIAPAFLPAAVGVLGFALFTCLLMCGQEGALLCALGRVLPLVAILYVAVPVWALLVARLALDPATGTGFAVAALGLLLRILVPMTALLDVEVRRQGLVPTSVPDLYPLADVLGTFAYVFGLTMVILATWQEGKRA